MGRRKEDSLEGQENMCLQVTVYVPVIHEPESSGGTPVGGHCFLHPLYLCQWTCTAISVMSVHLCVCRQAVEGLRFVDIPVAEITDPGRLVHSIVGEWHLLGGTLRTHTLATVPTVVLRYTELYKNQLR